jgi:hypothetical protein
MKFEEAIMIENKSRDNDWFENVSYTMVERYNGSTPNNDGDIP